MKRRPDKRLQARVSPWAALAAGWIVYCVDSHTLLLILLPVLTHEMGHWLCLRAHGCRIRALQWELCGLCLRYDGDPGPWGQAAVALAGPAAGLCYAWIAAHFGPSGELSAGISLLLSAFNLIPALLLDGGRVAEALLSSESARRLSAVSSILTAFAGLILFVRGRGAALAAAGLFLLAAQIRQGSSSAMSPL